MRITALMVCLVCGFAFAGDWPQILGPNRNGTSTETGLIDSFPAKGPSVVWSTKIGETYASPVVAGDNLLLFHRVGNDDVLDCLSASTGKAIWKHSYRTTYEDNYGKGDGPRSTPVVADDKVYTLSAAGELHCVNLKTGKKIWTRLLHADYEVPRNFFGVGTTPLVEGKLVLINVGGSGAGVVALNKDTGKEVWKATSQEASYSSPIAATIDGERHVIFFTREGLLGLDPATGKVRYTRRWRSRINASVNASMPVLIEGKYVFLTSSYDTGAILLEIRKDGLKEIWKNNDSLSAHFSTPVVVGDYLFGFEGRQEAGASLRCIEWKTGKVRWTEDGFGCGSLISADKKLFVLSEKGDLVLVEPNGSKYVEKARASVLGRPVRAHAALANGMLYAHDGRRLVCWKVKK